MTTHAPNSTAARDIAYMLHPYTNLGAHEERGPTTMTRGNGVFVYDEEGKEYLEGLAGLWNVSLGFSEERLVEAAARQMRELPYMHLFAHRSNMPAIDLCEKLVQMAPEGITKAFLVNSGSEAIDTMVKFVYYYNNGRDRPDKKKIISRRRGYHGITLAAASLTAIPLMQQAWDVPLPGFIQTDTPSWYRNGEQGESEEAFATRLAESLDALIEAEGPDTVAAFVAEPVMGAGGVVVPPATYFEKIQAVLRKHDVLMVADEVICGFGRTGNAWGSQTYNIKPDIMTCAKQLSSGYLPIAGVLIADHIYQVFREQSERHGALGMGYTYGGHPVAAAVALETLRIYEERQVFEHVRDVMPHFQRHVKALGDHPLVGEARGVGLIAGLELVADKTTREQHPVTAKAAAQVQETALANGLVVRGLPMDTIGICPPLIISESEIDTLFERLHRSLDTVHAAL